MVTNTERIQSHNAELREAIEIANSLPDAKSPVEIVLQSKTVTPTKSVQEVTADSGYTALEKVTVEPIPSEYIIPNGTEEGKLPEYEGEYTITPSVKEQTMQTKNKTMTNDVTIKAIPYAEVTNNSGGSTVTIC